MTGHNFPILRTLLEHQEKNGAANVRHASWGHCYTHFGGHPEVDIEKSALHLGFFLASWGMYRGSAFILQHDYTIHEEVVRELSHPRHAHLRGISIEEFGESVSEIIDLANWLGSYYGQFHEPGASETLTTKVLLGVLCCCPAYDRFARSGLKSIEIKPARLSRKSLQRLATWVSANAEEFTAASREIEQRHGVKYPPMKLVDAYLFARGALS